ncbi:tetraspanin-18-like [Zingiber officinale]|uniref:tetraspanin-18-like n=1 Tax=Zingiber officinale TaxID=94328 RepID=UPI001C4C9132|nr:tetraspanin-18-like [Zingiber officinale]XP_042405750.1 tetraspanin-18-like [Zingiber officinale]
MRPSLCRSCLAFALKFLHFLQTFVGASVLIYSLWVLNRWRRHDYLSFDLPDLPAPWFVCVSMGVGILICLISLIGYLAAETVYGCCLCFHAILTVMLIVLEVAVVGQLMLNKHWEEELPYDSTGELKHLRVFIEDNMDIFTWVAVCVIATQALSLLLTLILRATTAHRRVTYDSDEDFVVIRQPLLDPKGVGPSTSIDVRRSYYDNWNSRMRQKYGLNQSEFSQNPAFKMDTGKGRW